MGTRTADKQLQTINSKLDKFMSEFSEFKAEFHETVAAKDWEILQLRDMVVKLTDRLSKVEDKIADTEAKSRENNIVLSGQDIPSSAPNENCTETVRTLLHSKLNLVVPTADIVSATRIGKGIGGKKNLLVKFNNFENKMNVIRACRALKPNFYANDDLTPEKQTILYALRQCKKKYPNKVDGCSSIGGQIFVYLKDSASTSTSTNGRNRRIAVGNIGKLQKFCNDELDTELDQIIVPRQG